MGQMNFLFTTKRLKVIPNHGVQRRVISVVIFFVFFDIIIFCLVVAICDQVHNEETIFHLSNVLTASGNLF